LLAADTIDLLPLQPQDVTERPSDVASAELAANRLIVRFENETTPQQQSEYLAAAGHEIVRDLPLINAVVIELPETADLDQELARWSEHPDVLYAEPDHVLHIDEPLSPGMTNEGPARSLDRSGVSGLQIPNDPLFSELHGLHNTGEVIGSEDADIDAPEAWDQFTGSSDVVVAVIDTGVDYTHEDLAANIWTNPGEMPGDGIDNDGNGYVDDIHGIDAVNGDSDPMDDNGHGTHVAGTIAAVGNNNVGVAGVNWNAQIMAVKFLDHSGMGTYFGAIEAIDYVTRMKTDFDVNVVVSNNSYGGVLYDQALRDAIQASTEAGILFVAAAGNSGTNNDPPAAYPLYPASYDLDGIVAVAATTPWDALTFFSNYGPTTVDLAAPGWEILSTIPSNDYSRFSGTSMATPHVAGVAAMLKAFDSDATLTEMKTALLDGADPLPQLQDRILSGARLNAANSLALMDDPNEELGEIRGRTWNDVNGNGVWEDGRGGFVNPSNGHIYIITSSYLSYTEARAEAESAGGYLVSIGDSTEQSWVFSTFGSHTSPSDALWIGLSDEAQEGTWVWESGEATEYTNWGVSEPNGGRHENYAEMRNDGLWNDNGNGGGRRAIIEIDSPEPVLSGWTVYLDVNENGQPDAEEPTTITDQNGEYQIVDVPPGQYMVREVLRSGWRQTLPGDGGYEVLLAGGEIVDGIDFGNREVGSATTIEVGEHVLLPNTPDQVIPIYVHGGHDIQGLLLNVQIGDGYPDVPGSGINGPNITGVDLVQAGTVFGDAANTGHNFIETRDQIWIVGTTTSSGTVSADGLLAYVTVDTTGWSGDDGPWELKLAETFNGDTNFQSPSGQLIPTITNGSIRMDRLPVADPGGPYTVDEGGSIALDGSGSSDPDPEDVIARYEWDLDNDGIFGETGNAATNGDEIGPSPTFLAADLDGPSTWTVSLQVTDNHGGKSDAEAVEIAITNVAPLLQPLEVASTSVFENGLATLSGTIVDPGMADTFTVQVDWGDGSPVETYDYPAGTTGFSETHQYLDDDPSGTASDEYTITVSVLDDDGGHGSNATSIIVRNEDPVVNSVADQTIRRVDPLDLQDVGVTYTDVGTLDTHTATVDWGDESPPEQAIVIEPGNGNLGEVHSSHIYERGGFYDVTITVEDDDTGSHSLNFTVYVQAEVVDRLVFYNDSAWDGYDPATGTVDDNAIAVDKHALLPGETATFTNYTSYSHGLNGIMVDIVGLAGTPTAADFAFTVGNDSDPSGWSSAPAPANIAVRPGEGIDGSDRITIIWVDDDPYTPEREPGSVSNQWLQVTVLPTGNTGLAEADVFYFGNAIGESGNSTTETNVDTNDEIGARNHPRSLFSPATIVDAYDYDRDKRVDTNDEILARNNSTSAFTRLQLIAAPAAADGGEAEAGDFGEVDAFVVAVGDGDADHQTVFVDASSEANGMTDQHGLPFGEGEGGALDSGFVPSMQLNDGSRGDCCPFEADVWRDAESGNTLTPTLSQRERESAHRYGSVQFASDQVSVSAFDSLVDEGPFVLGELEAALSDIAEDVQSVWS